MPAEASLTSVIAALGMIAVLRTASAVAGPATDERRVIEAMETMYVALTKDDTALFGKVTTPDFLSFDGGMRFDGEALMQLIKKAHDAGRVYVWTVADPKVELFGQTALITYTNRGSVQEADGTKKDVTWLESALLKKQKGTWLIHFFHSTRTPPAKPPT